MGRCLSRTFIFWGHRHYRNYFKYIKTTSLKQLYSEGTNSKQHIIIYQYSLCLSVCKLDNKAKERTENSAFLPGTSVGVNSRLGLVISSQRYGKLRVFLISVTFLVFQTYFKL